MKNVKLLVVPHGHVDSVISSSDWRGVLRRHKCPDAGGRFSCVCEMRRVTTELKEVPQPGHRRGGYGCTYSEFPHAAMSCGVPYVIPGYSGEHTTTRGAGV